MNLEPLYEIARRTLVTRATMADPHHPWPDAATRAKAMIFYGRCIELLKGN